MKAATEGGAETTGTMIHHQKINDKGQKQDKVNTESDSNKQRPGEAPQNKFDTNKSQHIVSDTSRLINKEARVPLGSP